ncbi:MAG: hypothetical protein JW384_03147 [Nitrosomonadaceae bacterium]|nr:hypothetical protein [Nitrosomonadaceae bacterium]
MACNRKQRIGKISLCYVLEEPIKFAFLVKTLLAAPYILCLAYLNQTDIGENNHVKQVIKSSVLCAKEELGIESSKRN